MSDVHKMKRKIWCGSFLALAGFFLVILIGATGQADDCEKAKSLFKEAIELKGNKLEILVKKENLYRHAVELCPSYFEACNNLGDVCEKQGRFEEAIAEYKKAINLKPDAALPYFGVGDIYYKTNRLSQANMWYKIGLQKKAVDSWEKEEFDVTSKRVLFVEDIQKSGFIKADTLKGMFAATRGPGEIVSISFGEDLIPFAFDKYEIKPEAQRQLDEIGKALQTLWPANGPLGAEKTNVGDKNISSGLKLEVRGHTDSRGTDEYNLRLSEKRAESVIKYLKEKFNIPGERLIPKGYGKRQLLCTSVDSEACHALNRRVELIKPPVEEKTSRGVSRTDGDESKIILETGFLLKMKESGKLEVLKEDSRLRSKSDGYAIFVRPHQDCYVYVFQKDASNKISSLFPADKNQAGVQKGKDYWIPSFGKLLTLDETTGEETLYLIASSFAIDFWKDNLIEPKKMENAVKSIETRSIRVVKSLNYVESVSSSELEKNPAKINDIIERVEGEGAWVKVLKFKHE